MRKKQRTHNYRDSARLLHLLVRNMASDQGFREAFTMFGELWAGSRSARAFNVLTRAPEPAAHPQTRTRTTSSHKPSCRKPHRCLAPS